MWVYQSMSDKQGTVTYHVGYFILSNTGLLQDFHGEEVFESEVDAARLTSYLNGGHMRRSSLEKLLGRSQ